MFHQQRLLKLKEEAELDALVVTLPENVTYLTGYSSPLTKYFPALDEYAVLTGTQPDITLILPGVNAGFTLGKRLTSSRTFLYGKFVVTDPPEETANEYERSYADLMRSSNFPTALDAVVRALHDVGVTNGRIGIDTEGYLATQYELLKRQVPQAHILDAGDLMRMARAVKTPDEVNCLRKAAQVNEAAYLAMRAAARPGLTVADILQHYRMKIAQLGGEYAFSSTGAGTMGGGPWLDTRRMILKAGDLIRFDGVMRYNDYWADFGRTLAVGYVRNEAQATYDAIRAGYEAALSRVRAGALTRDIYRAGIEAVRKAGIPHFDRHHIGHGIGLHPYDYPVVSPNPGSMYATEAGSAALEAGMVLCIEVPLYSLGLGGWQLEDTVLVTDDGYEYITTLEREMIDVV